MTDLAPGRQIPNMLCRDIMRSPISCSETDPIDHCARLMRDCRIGFLPVLNAREQLVGVLTDRDLALRILAEGRPAATEAGAVMTRPPVTCSPEDRLKDAEDKLVKSRKSRIVVVDRGGTCAGIISLSDIAQAESKRRVGGVFKEVTRREAPVCEEGELDL